MRGLLGFSAIVAGRLAVLGLACPSRARPN